MIKIYTDTSANLPCELLDKYSIGILSFPYTVDGNEAAQAAGLDGHAFYEAMRAGASVKTSMINVAAFTDAFQAELEKGNDVIYVGMSGGISGAAHSAAMAAQELSEEYPQRKIAVIDTLAASLGEGLQVLSAARLLESGAAFEDIVDSIEKDTATMCQYFTVDDLRYLMRGGRLSKAATVIGTVLKIKPILTGNSDGKIVLCGKARGRRQSLAELADRYGKLAADKSDEIGIAHADDEEGADLLLEELKKRGFNGNCIKVCYEPVTGSHVGPGTVALFFRGTHK